MKKLLTILLFGLLFSCGDKGEPNVPATTETKEVEVRVGEKVEVEITDASQECKITIENDKVTAEMKDSKVLILGKKEGVSKVTVTNSKVNKITVITVTVKKGKKVPDYDIKTEMKGAIKIVTITDLWTSSPEGEKMYYHKFNLEKGKYVEGDDWDIAFYNRSIVVNGGQATFEAPYAAPEPERTGNCAIAIMGKTTTEDEAKKENLPIIAKETDGEYLTTTKVPDNAEFKQDKKGEFAIDDDSKGMFEYNLSPFEHIVTIKKNRFLIVKTHNGHYAKLKILSYYQGAGATAQKSVETGSMEEGLKYANYYTFTYKYNTKKDDKELE